MHELSGVRSLRQAGQLFAGRRSPQLFAGAVAAATGARLALGRWGRRDALTVATVLALRPFAEWAIHRQVLHAPSLDVRGRRVDPGASHRRHHRDPSDVDYVLVAPNYARQYVLAWAAIGAAVAAVLPGRSRRRDRIRPTLSGLAVAYASLLAYEWTHLLIHTSYAPRHRWFRQRRAQHRLHHFRSEHHWFGVTTDVADRILRTRPEARAVELSPTARTLGVEPAA
jgi:hypothetical protein